MVRSILPIQEETINPIGKMKIQDETQEYLELQEYSEHYHYSNGTIAFSQTQGKRNVLNPLTNKYQYYIWNETEKSVKYGKETIYFYDWYISLERNQQIIIDDSRFSVEYWRSQTEDWRTLDLYNHYFFEPVISEREIIFTQGYDDSLNFMNISYKVTNEERVKISIDFLAGQDNIIRFIWSLSGLSGDINANLTERTFAFDNIFISCNDIENDMNLTYEWLVTNKKLDVYIENYSVTEGDSIFIDPSFSSLTLDEYDVSVRHNGGNVLGSGDLWAGVYSIYSHKYWLVFDTNITDSVTSTSDVTLRICPKDFSAFEDGDLLEVWLVSEYTVMSPNETMSANDIYTNYWNPTRYGNVTFEPYHEIADEPFTINIEMLTDYWGAQKGSNDILKIMVDYDDELVDTDRGSIHDSSQSNDTRKPQLNFTYTVSGGNNAPSAIVDTAISSNLYAGISFTAISNVTDSDGAADLERAYLGLGDDCYDITFNSSVGEGSLSVNADNGSDYVISISASGSSITNGFQITWTVVLDWDWSDFDDSSTIDTFARSRDDEPEYSSWATDNTNADYENDLEVVLLNIAIDEAAESGGDAYINDTDWFRGGVQINCSGVVEYSGSTQLFNDSYGSGANVTLYFDGVTTQQGDTQILNGLFNNILYTPTSVWGVDTTAYFDVQILNIMSGGSDETDAGIEVTSKRDNEDPTTTFSSLVEGDPNTYIYATGQTLYFSDGMGGTDQLFTITVTASDSSGSGIYAVEMSAWDDDAEWNDTSSPYAREYSVDSSETSGSITLYAIDNVGNYDNSSVTITMTEDLTPPSGGTFAGDSDSASIGYAPINSSYDDDSTINFTTSGWTDGGAGLPTDLYSYNQSAWTSSTTVGYQGQSDGNITVTVYIRDNVGNNATASDWIIIDTDSPSGYTLTFERHTGIPDGYYAYLSGTTIYFNSGETDYFNITINDDGTIGNSLYWFVILDNNSVFETSSEDSSGLPLLNQSFNYNGDSSGSFIIRIVNNAGNYQTLTYTATEDVTAPTGSFATDSDSASIGYAPNTNYDDDSTINFTSSGWTDGGAGLPSSCYSYNQSTWTSSTTVGYQGQSDGNITVTVYVRDYVGNNGTSSDWVIIDTDSPSGYTLTWDRVNGSWPCVKNSTGFLFDDSQNNYTTVYINDTGTIGNSLFWFVVWDNNSVLETTAEDSSGLPDNKNFNYWNDNNGTFIILIVNNAGNYQNISVNCYDNYESGDPPSTTTTTSLSNINSSWYNDDFELIYMINNVSYILSNYWVYLLIIFGVSIAIIKLFFKH